MLQAQHGCPRQPDLHCLSCVPSVRSELFIQRMTQLHSRLCGCGGPHDVHFVCHLPRPCLVCPVHFPRPCLVCPVHLTCRCQCLCDLFLACSRPGRHACPVRKIDMFSSPSLVFFQCLPFFCVVTLPSRGCR